MKIEWVIGDDTSRDKFTTYIAPFTLDVSRGDSGKFYAVLFRGVEYVAMTGATYTKESTAKNAAMKLLVEHVMSEKRILADVEQHLVLAGYLSGS